jgi:hypothetical protein
MATRIALLLLSFLAPVFLRAQGCSDAGVCTAGPLGDVHFTTADSLRPSMPAKHFTRLTGSYAIGERGTTIVQSIAEVGLTGPLFGVQLRVPYMAAFGDLGSNSGVGDPVVTLNFPFAVGTRTRMEVFGGVKFAANRANASVDNKPLPMPYQTSLGTTDLLAGVQYRHGRITAALAYQYVWLDRNENIFHPDRWMGNMDASGYFLPAARQDDAVARLHYAIPAGRFVVQPGLLAIYHMREDVRMTGSLIMPRMDFGPVPVEGSAGLTLNLTADARYMINDRWSLDLSWGSPLIVRKERPDGLTRFFVLNAGLTHRFGER